MSSASTDTHAIDPAPAFAALGDRTRLALITRLSDGRARSITSLSADVDITRQGVTKHLRVLERAGLVRGTQVGRESRFALCASPLAELKSYLDTVSKQWDDALSRLKSFVEE
jgi:DNA-binding transcriptional ArsR family regulator